MRADRLVAVLLLLQRRGQVTAAEVAEELEISERTARRDLEALGMAGIPVYSDPGPQRRLAARRRRPHRPQRAHRRRGPRPVPRGRAVVVRHAQLKAALRKLVRALPEPFRAEAEAASAAVVVDPTRVGPGGRRAPSAAGPPRRAPAGGRSTAAGRSSATSAATARHLDARRRTRSASRPRARLVPRRRHRRGPAHASASTGSRRSQATGDAGRAARRASTSPPTWRSVTEAVAHRRSAVRADVSVQPSALTVFDGCGACASPRPAAQTGGGAEIRGHGVARWPGSRRARRVVEVWAPRRLRQRLARLAGELAGALHAITGAPVRCRTGRPPAVCDDTASCGTDVTRTDELLDPLTCDSNGHLSSIHRPADRSDDAVFKALGAIPAGACSTPCSSRTARRSALVRRCRR